jgi:secreted trypsin-like serine protease
MAAWPSAVASNRQSPAAAAPAIPSWFICGSPWPDSPWERTAAMAVAASSGPIRALVIAGEVTVEEVERGEVPKAPSIVRPLVSGRAIVH